MPKDTIVVLPTYNESGNIALIIDAIFSYEPEASILVVDDNSPDGTADIVRKISVVNPRVSLLFRDRKEGLGRAYVHAFRQIINDSRYQRILTMDADFSHNPKYIPEMIRHGLQNDVVIGSRYSNSEGGTSGWEMWRRILSRAGNAYCKLITGMPIYDCTAGFILINKKLLSEKKMQELDLSGYAFLIELKYLLWMSGAKIKEIPIVFEKRKDGESKLSNHIIAEGLIAPWKMRLKRRK